MDRKSVVDCDKTNNLEICRCRHHTNPNYKCFATCCGRCPVCQKNIKLFALDAHKEKCLEKHKEFIKSLESIMGGEEE